MLGYLNLNFICIVDAFGIICPNLVADVNGWIYYIDIVLKFNKLLDKREVGNHSIGIIFEYHCLLKSMFLAHKKPFLNFILVGLFIRLMQCSQSYTSNIYVNICEVWAWNLCNIPFGYIVTVTFILCYFLIPAAKK